MAIKSTKNEIILMGYSSIREGFAEAPAYGTFKTVGEAELVGREKFKFIDWLVAKRITRTPLSGSDEVKYDYLTDVQKPRRGYDL